MQIPFKNIINKVIDIKSDANKSLAIEELKKDVYLRGSNIFYLFCSALIASVGLDTGSPAVIIGAMLISPLMSPILGVGISLGIHDKESLFISVREFTYSVILSLLVSTIYFALTPLGNPTIEILSRIKPTALDIIIAFFGGIAGIVAITRTKIAAALPGVAIATALMPPICAAGYGLATSHFDYFFGAIYLFFINAVFISFSAYIIVRYLKFPVKEYTDRKKLLRTRFIFTVVVIIVAIPSFFIFYGVIKDVKLNQNLDKFIKEEIQSNEVKVIEWKYVPQKNNINLLNVYIVGSKFSNGKLDSLNIILSNFGIENTKINITQLSDEKGMEYLKGELKTDFLEELKLSQKSESERKKESIEQIQKSDSIRLSFIANDLRTFYPEILKIGFSQTHYDFTIQNDSNEIKNIPIFTIQWKKNISNTRIKSDQFKLYPFLKSKTSSDTIQIINIK